MRATARSAMAMSAEELEDLFLQSEAGAVPHGNGAGLALVWPGTRAAPAVAVLTRLLWWKGKVFRASTHDVVNLLSPLGISAIRASVRIEASLKDGEPCIVLDYSATSVVAHWVRDEIRHVGGGEYLGIVFVRDRKIPLWFWLTFDLAAGDR